MPDSFTFSLSPLDTEALLPQLSAALEKRVELHSRQRLPGLWRVTDKLSKAERVSQPVANHRKRLRQVLGLLLWVLGLLMLAPGLIDPQELFVPLLAGACAFFLGQLTLWLYQRTLLAILDLVCGLFLCMSALGAPNQMLGLLWAAVPCLLVSVAVLPSRRCQRTTSSEKEARNILAKYQNLKPHTVQAVFDHQGLTVSQPDGDPCVYPYSTVSFFVETPDLLLPFFQVTVLLLPKYDLTTGTMEQLRTMLAQQAPYEILESA